jgi:hypothetical protein
LEPVTCLPSSCRQPDNASMRRLPPDALGPVHYALPRSPNTAEARSVAGGSSPGWVFEDRSVLLIGSEGMEGFWLFADDAATDLEATMRDFAQGQGRATMAEAGCDYLEISSASANCQRALREALSPWDVEETVCKILRSEGTAPPTPSSPILLPVLDVLRSGGDAGVDVAEKIRLFWGTAERFMEAGGMGFCSMVDEQPVSVCMSAFIDGDVHCVDMETSEAFRRQGHGAATAGAFRQACQDTAVTMHWSCMEENVASYRLARKIGLVEVGTYTTLGIYYDESVE